MDRRSSNTIAAIATPHGIGAIGIVRISGVGAVDVARKIFAGRGLKHPESHKMLYGKIVRQDFVIDEVMLCVMLSPRSFTTEDMVEIYAHGGTYVLRRVLEAALAAGAAQAEPGEFTKRAFLNGRICLTQAQAVMDTIVAKTDAARRAAIRMLGGGLQLKVKDFNDRILDMIAGVELGLDYPEHEDEASNAESITAAADRLADEIDALVDTAARGRIIAHGLRTAIVGRPNVGKSTLLNALLGEDRAIVHETPGTTRDVLIGEAVLGDVHLRLMDTAGVRKTDDAVEQIGVDRAMEAARAADLLIVVLDKSSGVTTDDEEILQIGRESAVPMIAVMNKADLPGEPSPPDMLELSALHRTGLDTLAAKISTMFLPNDAGHDEVITHARHADLLSRASLHLRAAAADAKYMPLDIVAIPLRAAYMCHAQILGHQIADDVAEQIFSKFCVGK